MKWFKRIYLLYFFGFLVNLRPVDPFLFEFYMSAKNLSEKAVAYDVFPILSYSCLVNFFFVFLFADLCGYKVLIIISAFASIITTTTRIWSKTFIGVAVAEIFRGTSVAAEIGYYIFIYSYYDVDNFQRTTAFVRCFPLSSKLISAILAQMYFSQKKINYETLNVINLTATALATVLCFFLPSSGNNIYHLSTGITPQERFIRRIQENVYIFRKNFVESFNQKYVIIWTIWCIWSTWSFNQISTFIQPLWHNLHESKFNGGVEATLAFFGIIFVLMAGFKKIKWTARTVWVMPLLSGIQYIILLSAIAFSDGYIMFNYLGYIIFCVIHYFVMTAISTEIAKTIHKNCYGIVFGFINFFSAVLYTIMVCVLNDNFGFYVFSSRQQFYVYFVVFVVLYLVFFLAYEVRKRIDTVMARH